MVERVARGRILVPAAAALTVMAAGMLKPMSADAAGDTTLQIRVQVVEPCRIRIAPSGALDHGCGGGNRLGHAPVSVQISEVAERVQAAIRQHLTQPERPPLVGSMIMPPPIEPVAQYASSRNSPSARLAAANQRASDIAERIGQRVRHITVAF